MTLLLPARHHPRPGHEIAVARIEASTRVLGPGDCRVLWVQGCEQRCRNCVVPESHDRHGGVRMAPDDLTALLLEGPEVDGLTLSGGEPMLHAPGLVEVVRGLRAARPGWTFMCFTGYTLETLASRGVPSQQELLGEVDVLVDGPYVERLAGPLLFRGSSNQRLRALTPRGAAALAGRDDVSAGIEITVDALGVLKWTGVPPAGFRPALDDAIDLVGLVADHLCPPGTERSTTA